MNSALQFDSDWDYYDSLEQKPDQSDEYIDDYELEEDF